MVFILSYDSVTTDIEFNFLSELIKDGFLLDKFSKPNRYHEYEFNYMFRIIHIRSQYYPKVTFCITTETEKEIVKYYKKDGEFL